MDLVLAVFEFTLDLLLKRQAQMFADPAAEFPAFGQGKKQGWLQAHGRRLRESRKKIAKSGHNLTFFLKIPAG
jgi:hypothetical protein